MTISQALAHTIIAYTKVGLSEEASVEKVFSYMDTHGLSGFKPAVTKYVRRILNADREKATVRLYTAYPIEEEDKKKILSPFAAGYTLEEIIDSSLIGGFRTEHNYQYADATTKSALARLTQHLLHS